VSTATATTASASTVLASPATEDAARDTSNVSDCGLFRQRTSVTTVATASLAMLRQGTQETIVALASLVTEACVFSLSSQDEGCGKGHYSYVALASLTIEDSTRLLVYSSSHNYLPSRPRLSAVATW
jgi:hypothetical protein